MRFKGSFSGGLAITFTLALTISSATADNPSSAESVARIFSKISESAALADPAMVVIDKKTSEIIFEKNADSLRRPASVLKILSSAVALEYLGASHQFETRAYIGTTLRTIFLMGNFDPWMTSSSTLANKEHRASLLYLGSKAIGAIDAQSGFAVKSVVVRYEGMYSNDIRQFGRYLRSRGVSAKFVMSPTTFPADELEREVALAKSPSVGEMTQFALTWSDNLLAERLARAGAHKAGFAMTDFGVAGSVKELLNTLEIDSSNLTIEDGSGLSKLNRVSANIIAEFLMKIRSAEKFAAIYDGLPIAGLTGTLEDRYFATAPEAIGLVHAKTGTLNGTVSLAGYVDAGDREYIFVAIADRIKKGNAATTQARNTLDRLMGKIASPLFVAR